MAIKSNSATTDWAVIIGIHYYPEPQDKSLNGCVRDATAIKLFLKTGQLNVDMTLRTATIPTNRSFSYPLEEPGIWPAYKNFISSLRRVIDMAKCGDFVYIHYSGHDSRQALHNPAAAISSNLPWLCCRKIVREQDILEAELWQRPFARWFR